MKHGASGGIHSATHEDKTSMTEDSTYSNDSINPNHDPNQQPRG